MHETTIFGSVTLVIFAALIGGFIFQKLRQPTILGYIIAGLTLGTFFTRFTGDQAFINALAEIGVAFLMFTIGIEFSFARIKRVSSVAIIGGVIQIILTTLITFGLFSLFGFSLYEAFFMGAAFSLSSTAVVVKVLSDRGEVDTLPGEIMIAWLLVQDLAVLPMIIILPALGADFGGASFGTALTTVGISIAEAVFFLTVVIYVGRKVIPRILSLLTTVSQPEFLGLGIVALSLSAAYIMQLFGLSTAVGAFIAGILVADSVHKHAIFSEIKPLRNIFSIVFFVSLGLVLPGSFFINNLGAILGFTLIIMLIKFLIIIALTLYLGYHSKTSFLVGVGLIQVGEFAFILAREGDRAGLLSDQTYGMILSVAFLTILLFPSLFLYAPKLYRGLKEKTKHRVPKLYALLFSGFDRRPGLDELPLENHVVLCGYGRVGRYIGRALAMAHIPYIVIDYDQSVVNELRDTGIPVVYGDPADVDVLDFAQVEKARSVIIAIGDRHTQEMIITKAQTLNKHIQIISRTHHEEDQKDLKSLGANIIVQPEFEAGVTIARKILERFGVKRSDISGKILRLKIEHGMS